MASLRPVATRSATSRQASTVSDDYSRTVLIKVSALNTEHDKVRQHVMTLPCQVCIRYALKLFLK